MLWVGNSNCRAVLVQNSVTRTARQFPQSATRPRHIKRTLQIMIIVRITVITIVVAIVVVIVGILLVVIREKNEAKANRLRKPSVQVPDGYGRVRLAFLHAFVNVCYENGNNVAGIMNKTDVQKVTTIISKPQTPKIITTIIAVIMTFNIILSTKVLILGPYVVWNSL